MLLFCVWGVWVFGCMDVCDNVCACVFACTCVFVCECGCGCCVWCVCVFAQHLRGPRFVYRGSPVEHITVFAKRLLAKWPKARQALPTEDIPPESPVNGAVTTLRTVVAAVLVFGCPCVCGAAVDGIG